MLNIAKDMARRSGCREVSLLVFEQNEKAVKLYERNGFGVIDRATVVPHESIRYTGEVLLMNSAATPYLGAAEGSDAPFATISGDDRACRLYLTARLPLRR